MAARFDRWTVFDRGWVVCCSPPARHRHVVDGDGLRLVRRKLLALGVVSPSWVVDPCARCLPGLASSHSGRRLLLVAGYSTALVAAIWRSDLSSLVVASVMLVGVAEVIVVGSRRQRDLMVGHAALAVLLVTVCGGAGLRLIAANGRALEPTLFVYEAVVGAIPVRLAWAARAPTEEVVADLVVELGEAPSPSLRDQLAVTLRDPSLRVGLWSSDRGFVDDRGRPVALPVNEDGRAMTLVDWESEPYAVIVHDRSVLSDPVLVDAVTTATRLSAANVSLQRAVRSQVDELVESRRRFVSVADVERRRLERRLRDGPGRRLRQLGVQVEMAKASAGQASRQHLQRGDSYLAQALIEIDGIARGLHPGELSAGLSSALLAQADRSPVPVALAVTEERFAAEVEATVYYLCAECLANVAKHADARRAAIDVCRDDDVLRVVVDDDGQGGADVRAGSGLQGIFDRVEAIGGTMRVDSPTGGGTRVVAELPLGHHPT